ncbi:hypothetical protein GCM10011494_02910 [Novosphingobium endophyticum]|uniref:Uncharacterized protein n=1 Tax=Novosphingobium endophyticum TaxID=1955250 RepID=A0A916TPN8_9SPHN|nr:hypothetical protein GCM10011494_02910 [Novosphingobium endophyticum]
MEAGPRSISLPDSTFTKRFIQQWLLSGIALRFPGEFISPDPVSETTFHGWSAHVSLPESGKGRSFRSGPLTGPT